MLYYQAKQTPALIVIKNYEKIKITRPISDIKPKSTPEAEKLFWALKKRGIPTTLKKWDGHKHIDLAIPKVKLNIEVDGAHHNFKSEQALSDLKRTTYSLKKEYYTIRIPNSLIKDENSFKETVNYIVEIYNDRLEQSEDEDDYFSFSLQFQTKITILKTIVF